MGHRPAICSLAQNSCFPSSSTRPFAHPLAFYIAMSQGLCNSQARTSQKSRQKRKEANDLATRAQALYCLLDSAHCPAWGAVGTSGVPKVNASQHVTCALPLPCTFQGKRVRRSFFLGKGKVSGIHLHWQRNKNDTCSNQIP